MFTVFFFFKTDPDFTRSYFVCKIKENNNENSQGKHVQTIIVNGITERMHLYCFWKKKRSFIQLHYLKL